ncbi:MAG: extracellular solute-binding protein [Limnochordia bacterium]
MASFHLPGNYLYALPHYAGTWAVWYNQDLFDQAGVPSPSNNWTWDDLTNISRKVTMRNGDETLQWGVVAFLSLERVTAFIRQKGGRLFPEGDNSICSLNEPAAIGALDFLHGLIHKEQVMPPGGLTSSIQIASGNAAIEFDGSWALNWLTAAEKWRFGLVEPPRGPVAKSSIVAFEGYGITSNSKDKEAAWKWLMFLTSREANEIRAITLGLQSARRSAATVWMRRVHTMYPGTSHIDLSVFTNIWAYALPQPMYSNQSIAGPMIEAGLSRIFVQGESPRTVMDAVVPAVNAALAEAKAKK